MGKKDIALARYFEDPGRYADLINGYVFGGEQVVRAKDVVEKDTRATGVARRGKKRSEMQKYRDIIRRVALGAEFVLIGLEHQDEVHYAMPVRSMLYDALEYTEQVEALKRRHRECGDRLEGDAFLSGITRDDRIMPVVTLTVYYGAKPWDGPRSLYDMLEMDRDSKEWEALRAVLPDYRLNLVELNNMRHLERFRSSLQPIFTVLQYNRRDKRKFYEYLENHREELRQLDDDSVRAMLALWGEQ